MHVHDFGDSDCILNVYSLFAVGENYTNYVK